LKCRTAVATTIAGSSALGDGVSVWTIDGAKTKAIGGLVNGGRNSGSATDTVARMREIWMPLIGKLIDRGHGRRISAGYMNGGDVNLERRRNKTQQPGERKKAEHWASWMGLPTQSNSPRDLGRGKRE